MAETAADEIGKALAARIDTVFGLVGSGNFHLTNALTKAGATLIATRHEAAAITAADAYARVSGRPGVVTVHQGPGLTNTMTGLAEAAKSRTPLLVLAPETTSPRSNFYVDQAALAKGVGAEHVPVRTAADLSTAWNRAVHGRRTVLAGMPLEFLGGGGSTVPTRGTTPGAPDRGSGLTTVPDPRNPFGIIDAGNGPPAAPGPPAVAALADALTSAARPVFIAGRGARRSGEDLKHLAERVFAPLATSAVSRGLFKGEEFNLDVSGGFASPVAAEIIAGADLVVGWGCALNMWTTRHNALIGPSATVVQVDDDPDALGAHRPVDLGVTGDVGATARAVLAELDTRGFSPSGPGYRSPALASRLEREGRWRDVPFEPVTEDGRIDPRTLTIALDDLLPPERTVAVDSGNFMGYPSMFLDVPDADGFVFTQAFQSVGLGLASAIGAAAARPDRLTVAACGDGGLLMGASELETVVRLGLDMIIVVYDDEAYGAEVHHFGPSGADTGHVRFPPADLAAIARGYGFSSVTVRSASDLVPVRDWVSSGSSGRRPLLVDAKVARGTPSWWLEEAFRGH